ncbi:hypothetical protein MJO28_008691 [Puccinia striiformis f. sp. tritici]|uniref:Uncharacterized protein n=1 Tax=Puccinia striiformis f. sp. tritici TaxID=168172 RepID=A0ACC0EEL0_9BASI|nr:hypothetical protein MJO28_008691 [Puccinia striiformis f. sp. tritici]
MLQYDGQSPVKSLLRNPPNVPHCRASLSAIKMMENIKPITPLLQLDPQILLLTPSLCCTL